MACHGRHGRHSCQTFRGLAWLDILQGPCWWLPFFLLLLGSSYEDICRWGGQGSVEEARRFSAGRGVLRLQAATREGWHRSEKKRRKKSDSLSRNQVCLLEKFRCSAYISGHLYRKVHAWWFPAPRGDHPAVPELHMIILKCAHPEISPPRNIPCCMDR